MIRQLKPLLALRTCADFKGISAARSRVSAYPKLYMSRTSRFSTDTQNDANTSTPSEPQKMNFAEFDNILPNLVNTEPLRFPARSASFVDYIDFSETLQSLLLLGVELYKIEQKYPDALQYIPMLDLRKDVKPRLEYLISQGVLREELGEMITNNPKILDPSQDLVQFKEVFQYLRDMKFKEEELLSLVVRLPTILTIPVGDLDGILGFYQKLSTNRAERVIKFTNNELKSIIIRCPRLVTANLRSVYEQVRTLEVACGFTLREIRKLINGYPWILIRREKGIELLYKFYTREMKLTNEEISDFPGAFGTRIQLVYERHEYLKKLNKAQYKRDQPGYISLFALYTGADQDFCQNHQLGEVSDFWKFIKTI